MIERDITWSLGAIQGVSYWRDVIEFPRDVFRLAFFVELLVLIYFSLITGMFQVLFIKSSFSFIKFAVINAILDFVNFLY